MTRIQLCGGTNHGRRITVQHGTAVVVAKRGANGFETYRRPILCQPVDGVEYWQIDTRSAEPEPKLSDALELGTRSVPRRPTWPRRERQ